MAHLHHFKNHNNREPSLFENVGQKVKSAAEIAMALKGIYDVGRYIYSGIAAAAPVLTAAAAVL